ncbi:hypothetical protein SADUNF_Sadunf14G0019700 [Salix dunnii]|uniref:Uncharacterized protein n=1 Tax=Salix dunnii TaxID=1413687 RepID=A0A835JFA5_9ROSI|nr:hypothetical protein SADUNF_Sadunf14G0019700 [Salix dunnii]
MSRAVYESKLRALRQDSEVSEDISLDVVIIFPLILPSLRKWDTRYRGNERRISIETPDAFPASAVLHCGSCSLQVRLLINAETKKHGKIQNQLDDIPPFLFRWKLNALLEFSCQE